MNDETVKVFEWTTQEFLKLLHPLTENALNFKFSDQSWSPGQIGHHILKSYASVETLLGKTRSTMRKTDENISKIKEIFLDYSIQMQSPEFVIPTNKPINKAELLTKLENRIIQITEVIKTTDLSLTCIDFAIPEYGEFTRLEWIWFNIYHTQRHTHQLKSTIQGIPDRILNQL